MLLANTNNKKKAANVFSTSQSAHFTREASHNGCFVRTVEKKKKKGKKENIQNYRGVIALFFFLLSKKMFFDLHAKSVASQRQKTEEH